MRGKMSAERQVSETQARALGLRTTVNYSHRHKVLICSEAEGKDYKASRYRQSWERSSEEIISFSMQAIDRPSQRIDPILATRITKL